MNPSWRSAFRETTYLTLGREMLWGHSFTARIVIRCPSLRPNGSRQSTLGEIHQCRLGRSWHLQGADWPVAGPAAGLQQQDGWERRRQTGLWSLPHVWGHPGHIWPVWRPGRWQPGKWWANSRILFLWIYEFYYYKNPNKIIIWWDYLPTCWNDDGHSSPSIIFFSCPAVFVCNTVAQTQLIRATAAVDSAVLATMQWLASVKPSSGCLYTLAEELKSQVKKMGGFFQLLIQVDAKKTTHQNISEALLCNWIYFTCKASALGIISGQISKIGCVFGRVWVGLLVECVFWLGGWSKCSTLIDVS